MELLRLLLRLCSCCWCPPSSSSNLAELLETILLLRTLELPDRVPPLLPAMPCPLLPPLLAAVHELRLLRPLSLRLCGSGGGCRWCGVEAAGVVRSSPQKIRCSWATEDDVLRRGVGADGADIVAATGSTVATERNGATITAEVESDREEMFPDSSCFLSAITISSLDSVSRSQLLPFSARAAEDVDEVEDDQKVGGGGAAGVAKSAELSITMNWSELGEPICEIFCFGLGGSGGGQESSCPLLLLLLLLTLSSRLLLLELLIDERTNGSSATLTDDRR